MLNMWRIVCTKSKMKKLIGICVLSGCILYFFDIGFSTSTVARITPSKLSQKQVVIETDSNSLNTKTPAYPQKQQHSHVADEGQSLMNISQNTTMLGKVTKADDTPTTLTPEVFSLSTTMTFNNTLAVHCKESPYVECVPPVLKPITGKIFKIAYVKTIGWITASSMDITRCEINQCVINYSAVTNDTDIVLIYGVYFHDNFNPGQRWPHQLYIMQGWEPPLPEYTYGDYITNGTSPWNSQINLVMSYRLDSDIFVPYSRLKFSPKPLAQRPNYYDIAKAKNRTAVWIVTNCVARSKRMEYVREMQKYIDIDIYGRCGTPCLWKNETCNNDWTTKYKFYLSFENSLCTDYVTEKFFKLFAKNTHVIPVVRGGADYDKHFPEFTYINSAHFKTAKDLALHLKHLASDLENYSKYLEYKDLYTLKADEGIQDKMACQICNYLHTHQLPKPSQTYNITKYFADGHCHLP